MIRLRISTERDHDLAVPARGERSIGCFSSRLFEAGGGLFEKARAERRLSVFQKWDGARVLGGHDLEFPPVDPVAAERLSESGTGGDGEEAGCDARAEQTFCGDPERRELSRRVRHVTRP